MEVIDLSEQETTGQETKDTATEAQETVKGEPLSEQQSTEEAEEPPKAPEPSATGDGNITIFKHDIYRKSGEGDTTEAVGVELGVKNVSDKVIGCAVFEAVFYDIGGSILDTIERKTTELRPNANRNIHITYSGPESDKVKSYHVRLAKTVMTPEPTATGNEKVTILKHALSRKKSDEFLDESPESITNSTMGAELAIRNVSDSTIATLLFEALFYDVEGNILDTVKHREINLRPKTSRAIYIQTLIALNNRVKSYAVRITRTITADVEKVQLRRYERLMVL
jgi:hypothetical protein